MKKSLLILLGAGLPQLLTGCAVYMPMQCAAPQITDKHQAELTGNTYLNGRYEVAGTYSPGRHLLVRAAYGALSNPDDSLYYRGKQYELGAGTYWPLGSQWLLGGLAGFGQAQSAARYRGSGGIISIGPPPSQHVFEARYNKMFGEVYGIFQASETVSFGAAYRVTQVYFTSLTDVGIPINISQMTRGEPMFFFRTRLGIGPTDTRPVQLQLTTGTLSAFGLPAPDAIPSSAEYQLQKPRGYLTLGISVFPHCLLRLVQPDKSLK